MSWSGVYINLDRSTERRAQIERELHTAGIFERYARMPAIDGRETDTRPEIAMRGAVGCFLSHLQAVQAHRGSSAWLHVLEDDAVLSRFAAQALDAVTSDPGYGWFDLVFTNARINAYPSDMVRLAELFDSNVQMDSLGNVTSVRKIFAWELRSYPFFLATSYLVNPRSIEKVAAALEAQLASTPFRQVDLAYSSLVNSGAIRAACLIPFVTAPGQAAGPSTIQVNDPMPWLAPMNVLDRALFADRDMPNLQAWLRQLERAPPGRSKTHALIGDIYRAMIAGPAD